LAENTTKYRSALSLNTDRVPAPVPIFRARSFQEYLRTVINVKTGRRQWGEKSIKRTMAHLKTFSKWIRENGKKTGQARMPQSPSWKSSGFLIIFFSSLKGTFNSLNNYFTFQIGHIQST
jgi:hypothetical protein